MSHVEDYFAHRKRIPSGRQYEDQDAGGHVNEGQSTTRKARTMGTRQNHSFGVTKYDYLKGRTDILSHDGESSSIILLDNLNEGIFVKLGETGRLKGRALEDYNTSLLSKEEKTDDYFDVLTNLDKADKENDTSENIEEFEDEALSLFL